MRKFVVLTALSFVVVVSCVQPNPSNSYTNPIFTPTTPPAGWPNSTNTGLTIAESSLSTDLSSLISNAGAYKAVSNQTVENLRIDGRLIIDGDNITVRNCRIFGDPGTDGYSIEIRSGSGIVIEHNVIGKDADTWPNGTKGICIKAAKNVTATIESNYIRYLDDGIFLGNGSSTTPSIATYQLTIRNNYITYIHSYDPNVSSDNVNQHKGDGIEALGPLNDSIIEHNSIDSPIDQTSCILIQPNWAPLSNVSIHNNWFSGGGYSLKVRKRNYNITGIVITDNRFSRSFTYGSWDCDTPIDTNAGNFYVDGGVITGMND